MRGAVIENARRRSDARRHDREPVGRRRRLRRSAASRTRACRRHDEPHHRHPEQQSPNDVLESGRSCSLAHALPRATPMPAREPRERETRSRGGERRGNAPRVPLGGNMLRVTPPLLSGSASRVLDLGGSRPTQRGSAAHARRRRSRAGGAPISCARAVSSMRDRRREELARAVGLRLVARVELGDHVRDVLDGARDLPAAARLLLARALDVLGDERASSRRSS